ncbi:MAG: hypothetical protein HGB36_11900 [Chlorobiaceae bacterium]|nr:hypothetical protein [Chlorobiaceae bacterium]
MENTGLLFSLQAGVISPSGRAVEGEPHRQYIDKKKIVREQGTLALNHHR